MKAIVVMTVALVVLAGCNKSAPSSGADASSGTSSKAEMDKQFGNLNTGRVVDSGAAAGACDAACQSRIKK